MYPFRSAQDAKKTCLLTCRGIVIEHLQYQPDIFLVLLRCVVIDEYVIRKYKNKLIDKGACILSITSVTWLGRLTSQIADSRTRDATLRPKGVLKAALEIAESLMRM